MYIVHEAYDDNSATILDIVTLQRQTMTEQELKNFSKNHDVMGLSVSNNKINYIHAYDCISFATENEANEYIRDNNLSYQNKMKVNEYYYVLYKNNKVYHVDYFIMHYTEIERVYVSEKGYCGYREGAKSFDKKTAYEKAASMNKAHAKKYNAVSSNHWVVERYFNRYAQ